MHPRLTRAGLAVKPWAMCDDLSLEGKIEFDFQAGGTESRQLVRMRHGYAQINYTMLHLLLGQTWDLISPLFPSANGDTLMWNAGNLGDRRPQARLSFEPKVGDGFIRVAAAMGQPNAVDSQDLDRNGELDGFDAAMPQFQFLAEIAGPYWTDERPFQIGGSGHYGIERVNDVDDTNPPAGALDFGESADIRTWSLQGHLQVPIIDEIWLAGEVFYGENLSDVRGGIGQAVNTTDGDVIASAGGWGELGAAPFAWWSLHAGGSIDSPTAVSPGQRSRNYTIFGATRFRPWKPFTVAIEYVRWVTEYEGFGEGNAHRGNIWTSFTF
jgi:hypothetical protein